MTDINLRITADDADAEKTLDDLGKAFNKFVESTGNFNKFFDTSSRDVDALNTRLTKLQKIYAQFEKRNALIDSFRQQGKALVELNREMRAAEQAAASLAQQQEAVAGRLAKDYEDATNAVRRTSQQLEDSGNKITGLNDRLVRLQELYKSFSSRNELIDNFRKQGKELQKLRTQLNQAQEVLQRTVQEQKKGLKGSGKDYADAVSVVQKLTAAYEKQLATVKASKSELNSLGISVGKIGAAQKQFADAMSRANAQIERTRVLLEKYKADQKEIAVQLKEAEKAVKASAKAQKEGLANANAEYAKAVKNVQALSQSYERNREAIRKTKAELKEAGISVATLGKSQKDLNAYLQRTESQIDKTAASIDKFAQSQRRATEAQNRLRNSGRQALSFYQRLRGEVVALTTAYVGLFAAGRGIASVVNTADTLDAARTRFQIALGGDAKAAAEEMEFVRKVSSDLSLDFLSLAEGYSQFLAAVPDANEKIDEMRQIFEGVAVAARVNRLTIDQQKGVFVAFTQIVSKGLVTMEELRQQLGDRLAGAVQDYAKSLGIGTEEFLKLVQAGAIGTDTLVDFSNQLKSKFGPGLDEALKSPAARIQEFKNSLTELSVALIESGFVDTLVGGLGRITDKIRDPEIQKGFVTLANVLLAVADAALVLVDNIDLLIPVLGGLVALKVGRLFRDLYVGFGGLLLQFGRLQAVISGSSGLLAGLKLLAPRLLALAGPIGAIVGAATALYFVFNDSAEPMDDYAARLKKITEEAKNLSSANLEAQLTDTQALIIKNEAVLRSLEKQRKRLADQPNLAGVGPGFVDSARAGQLGKFDRNIEVTRKRLENLRKEVKFLNEELAGKRDQESRDGALNALRLRTTAAIKDIEKRLQKLGDEEEKFVEKAANSVAERFALVAAKYNELRENLKALSESTDERDQRTAAEGILLLDKLLAEERAAIQREFDEEAAKAAEKRAEKLAKINDEIATREAETLSRRLDVVAREYADFVAELERVGDKDGLSAVERLIGLKKEDEIVAYVREVVSRIEEEIANAQVSSADERINLISAKYSQLIDEVKVYNKEISEELERQKGQAVILDVQQKINDHLEQRSVFLDAINTQMEAGLLSQTEAQQKIKDYEAEVLPGLREMVAAAIEFAEALGNVELVEKLKAIQSGISGVKKEVVITVEQVNSQFASSFVNAFDQFIDGSLSAKDAFKQFASDFLRQIARMILQQTILNALQNSGIFGGAVDFVNPPVAHGGGVIGSGVARSRRVAASVFSYAQRLHSGGLAGNEVPTILQKGEEVLTRNDPRHRANGGLIPGQAAASQSNVSIINQFDSKSIARDAYSGVDGKELYINQFKSNITEIRQLLRI